MSLRKKNAARKLELDKKAIALANDMIDTDLVRGKSLELLEDVQRLHEERGFLTE